MSLLREIQDAAISTDSPIGDLLRRCKVLAARLGSAEFRGSCRVPLFGEMISMGSVVSYSGIVGMHCVQCGDTTPIWPRAFNRSR